MAVIHHTLFPDSAGCPKDLDVLTAMLTEAYERYAPLLVIQSLNLPGSGNLPETKVDDFYFDSRTADRKYTPFNVHVFGPLDPYTFDLTYFGIDTKRELTTFSVLVPELETLGLTLKEGDVIEYDGQNHEILTVKRNEEAYYAHTNVCLELVLATFIPNVGS